MYINKIEKFIVKILILIFFFYSYSAVSANLDVKIIGNKNLDQEFIESIVDLNVDLKDDELVNYIIKELFSCLDFLHRCSHFNFC